MRLRLVLVLYNLLLPFALLVLLPVSVIRMRKRGGYGSRFWQRFGFFDRETRAQLDQMAGHCLWMHAVSVGEVNVAKKLIAELRHQDPHCQIVLSVTTSTGYAVATEKPLAGLTVIYSPVDLVPVVWRVFGIVHPQRLVLVEAEIWPNLVRHASRSGCPVWLVNARMSPRSERRFRKFRGLVQPVFGMLDRVLVQEAEDVERWASVGFDRSRIILSGSIKYDLGHGAPKPARVEEFRGLLQSLWGTPLPRMLLCSSTHGGEEAALAAEFQKVRSEFPGLRLLIAPRHAERRAEVKTALESLGLKTALRSALTDAPADPDVLVIDSTGELRDWQCLPEIVIIGKSFLAKGGQNPAEAIAAGVPVVTGPRMENFGPLMTQLLAADGITRLEDLAALAPALVRMLQARDESLASARRGQAVLERHRGAAERTAALLIQA